MTFSQNSQQQTTSTLEIPLMANASLRLRLKHFALDKKARELTHGDFEVYYQSGWVSCAIAKHKTAKKLEFTTGEKRDIF
jgi:hypothetical protein